MERWRGGESGGQSCPLALKGEEDREGKKRETTKCKTSYCQIENVRRGSLCFAVRSYSDEIRNVPKRPA